MTYTTKTWANAAGGATPLGATGLNDWESRIAAGFASIPAGGGASSIPWINVRDVAYGAVGNGTTDDTAAINLAIAAIPGATGTHPGGAVLYFPEGKYKITGTLFIRQANTMVFCDGSAYIFNSAPQANQALIHVLVADVDMFNVWLGGSGSKGNGVGVRYGVGPVLTTTSGTTTAGAGSLVVASTTIPGLKVGDLFNVMKYNATKWTVTAASWASGTATFTTSATHDMVVGSYVTVAGMTPSAYNTTGLPITAVTGTTFQIAIASDPGTATVFGTADDNGAVETMKVSAITNSTTYAVNRAQSPSVALNLPSATVVQAAYIIDTGNKLRNINTCSYRCKLYSPRIQSMNVGIEIAIDETSTSAGGSGHSSGDNTIDGGYVSSCQVGILNKGFVNRCFGTTIATCNIGVDHDPTRASQKFETFGMTINACSVAAIWVRGGNGNSHTGLWAESNGAPTEQVRIGQSSSASVATSTWAADATSTIAHNTHFYGTTTLSMDATNIGTAVMNVRNSRGLIVDHVTMATDGGKATIAAIIGSIINPTDSNNRIHRLTAWTGSSSKNRMSGGAALPPPHNAAVTALTGKDVALTGTYTLTVQSTANFASAGSIVLDPFGLSPQTVAYTGKTSTTFTGCTGGTGTYGGGTCVQNTAGNAFIVEEHYDTDTNSAVGSTIGGSYLPAPDATYTVFKQFSNGGTLPTYFAKNQNGHIAAFAIDTALTSGLRTVLECIAANDTHLHFPNERYHFLDAPLGTEFWAGVEDHATFQQINGLLLTGESMTAAIISNRSNYAGDTHPLQFSKCYGVSMKELTIEACGGPRSTSDAVRVSNPENSSIERVEVRRSRGSGIHFDASLDGSFGHRSSVAKCYVQGRPRAPRLDLVSGGSLTVSNTYEYAVSYVDQDLASNTGLSGTNSGTSATVTWTAHPFVIGDIVYLTAASDANYVGNWTILSVTANTFTFTTASAGGGTSTGIALLGPLETRPSLPTQITTTAGNLSVRVNIPRGPYGTIRRRVYRRDVTGVGAWQLMTTYFNNVNVDHDDGGGSPTIAVFGTSSQIPAAGVKLSGVRGVSVYDCHIAGTGDPSTSGPYGIDVRGRASSGLAAQYNRVHDNHVTNSYGHGIRLSNAAYSLVQSNHLTDIGESGTSAAGVGVDETNGVSPNNTIEDNIIVDARSAVSPSGAARMVYGVYVNGSSSTGNAVKENRIAGFVTAAILDSGLASVIGSTPASHKASHALGGSDDLGLYSSELVTRLDVPQTREFWTTTATLTASTVYFMYFRPRRAFTMATMNVACSTAAGAGATLQRAGIYSSTEGGDVTPLGHSANQTTALNATGKIAFALVSANLDGTAGSWPTSITFVPGSLYAFAIIGVAWATAPLVRSIAGNSQISDLLPPQGMLKGASTDLLGGNTLAGATQTLYSALSATGQIPASWLT